MDLELWLIIINREIFKWYLRK